MFDKAFFDTVLGQRVAEACPMEADKIPVVLLHLIDGTVLDVCHVVEAAECWVALMHFQDKAACERMDLSFVRYETIARVTVSPRSREERKAGFMLRPSPPAVGTVAGARSPS